MRPLNLLLCAAAASMALATSAHAGEVPPRASLAESEQNQSLEYPSQSRDQTVQLPQRLDIGELKNSRGRATIVLNDQEIDGTVTGNSLGDYSAGSIALSDNALSNFSGVGNFLFNTGAQNNLQAGMTLTIVVDN